MEMAFWVGDSQELLEGALKGSPFQGGWQVGGARLSPGPELGSGV